MEIRDYLQAIRRWLWLPVVVPLVAGGGAGLLLLKQPVEYQADATVVVPAVSARGFSTSAAAQYVATFKDVLVSQPLVQQVHNKFTAVPTTDLVKGLSASTVTASSNIIHVTYIGYIKSGDDGVRNVVNEATRDTLDIVAQPQLAQAKLAIDSANAQLATANSAITAFTASTGQVLPDQQFRTKQSELSQLLLQLQQTQIAGDQSRAALLQAVIATRQSELTSLAASLSQYTSLTQQRQAALTVVAHDQQLMGDAQALVSADHQANTVSVTGGDKVSRLANVLKFSAIAAAVGLILALALILLMELTRDRRAVAGSTAGTGGVPPAGSATPGPRAAAGAAPVNGAHVQADEHEGEREMVTTAGPKARR